MPANSRRRQTFADFLIVLFGEERRDPAILHPFDAHSMPLRNSAYTGGVFGVGPLAVSAFDTQLRFSSHSRNTVEIGQVVLLRVNDAVQRNRREQPSG